MSVGIVALSFAKRAVEPNPLNMRLALATEEVVRQINEAPPIVVAQWEVACALQQVAPALIATQQDATRLDRNGRLYLDTQDVLTRAFTLFAQHGVTDVIVVANPFLHLQAAERIVGRAGFTVVRHGMPRVGFDDSPLNLQWWCRGPARFVAYLAIQVLGVLLRQNFHGIWEKPRPQ